MATRTRYMQTSPGMSPPQAAGQSVPGSCFPAQPFFCAPPQVPATPQNNSSYKAQAGSVTGLIQVVCGIVIIIFGVRSVVFNTSNIFVGSGLWSGPMFLVTGSFGISSRKQKRYMIITYLVWCILSVAFAAYCLTINVASALGGYYYYYSYGAVRLLFFLAFVLEGITAIVGSVYCCLGGVCETTQSIPQQVIIYTSAPGAHTTSMTQENVAFVTADQPGQYYLPTNQNYVVPQGAPMPQGESMLQGVPMPQGVPVQAPVGNFYIPATVDASAPQHMKPTYEA